MKQLINILFGSAILFSFAQCGNGKELSYKLQETPIFKTTEAIYQSWIAGVAGGGSGINVMFKSSNTDENIVLDSLYFRNKKAKLERKGDLYIGRFMTEANKKPELIMHSDSDQEYGNKPPVKTKFPFELKDDEAVIKYLEKGKSKFIKIRLTEKPAELYP